MSNYKVLKIRSPHGNTETWFLGKDKKLLAKFKKRRDYI